jgi:hypothetical protein
MTNIVLAGSIFKVFSAGWSDMGVKRECQRLVAKQKTRVKTSVFRRESP